MPSIVNAVPDSFVTGPYKISFDLGTPNKNYSVVSNDPVIDETLGGEKRTDYSVTISNETEAHFMTIGIITVETRNPSIITGSQLEEYLKQSNANDPRISDFQSSSRTIDSMSGAVTSMNMKMDSGMVVSVYSAMYPTVFDPSNSMVNIMSLYPWNEGTLQLLKTIHVEKA